MLQNGSFSEDWETLEPIRDANFLENQRPAGWQLSWLDIGRPLYDDPGTKARGIPECVHKLSKQLPPNEQMGQPDALILAGDAVYKIFSAGAEFGAQLTQTVTGLQPGSRARLVVPIQAHLHGDPDAYGAESGVWVNGEGGWVHGFAMGDRNWYRHDIPFTVPDSGRAEILIRVKSKWPRPKDFFVDGITLDAEPVVEPPPADAEPPAAESKKVYLRLPPGVQVKQGASTEADVVEVNLGPGLELELL